MINKRCRNRMLNNTVIQLYN